MVICAAPPGTAPPPDRTERGTIIRSPVEVPRHRLLRKAGTLLKLLTEHFTTRFDPNRKIYHSAVAYLSEHGANVAAIVACGEPFILFRYAHLLSRRFEIPYVLDYRDGWTTDHLTTTLQRWTHPLHDFFEKKYLNGALLFSSVSTALVDKIRAHTGCATPGLNVPNGVDLDLLPPPDPRHGQDGVFNLVYTGVVYDERYIDIFIEGLSLFLSQHSPRDFRVTFYGVDYYRNRAYDRLCELRRELPEIVFLEPRVSSGQSLQLQAGGTALLSFIAGTQADGLYGAKTYEYIASGRPILVIPSTPNRATDLFADKRYQIFALDPLEVAQELAALYQAHCAGSNLRTEISEEEIYGISRQRSSKTLFSHIQDALARV